MKMCRHNRNRHSGVSGCRGWKVGALLLIILGPTAHFAHAQAANQASLAEQIQKLSDAMASTQAQLDQSQRQMEEMRKQLIELQQQMAQSGAGASTPAPPSAAPAAASSSSQDTSAETAAAVQDIREHEAVMESQIATHEQSKVGSESRYPVKVTGMLLLNGFVNSGAVDMAATPTVAVPGSGSAGATVRQTILGIDARGPHVFGASSFADIRVDFASSPALNEATTGYAGYNFTNSTLLRLRTAHAGLQWERTQAFFSLDHPLISPETPSSLTAVAEPPLAWSGNLWTWNPQAGVTQNLASPESRGVQLQAALIDVGDAPLTPPVAPTGTATITPPSAAEQSSRPGVEARIALLGASREEDRSHIGVGGYFAPHLSSLGRSYDSWAATLDTRLLLFAGLQFSGSFYRGRALGGLGGGGYKDFAYSPNPNTGGYYFRPLDDVGGWAQLKEKVGERLEFNGAYGMDNVFAGQLRHYFVIGGSPYQNLAVNRTYTGNVIYSPSSYLLFSLEYRRLESTPIVGLPSQSNVFGIGTGYKF